MKKTKINDIEVKPLNIKKVDINCVKGKDFFPNLTPNVLLLARKNSGKTTVLYNILKGCINKRTKAYIFCSTVYKDPSYAEILTMLEQKNVEYEVFTDVIEGRVNHLEKIVDDLKKQPQTDIFEEETQTGEGNKDQSIKFIMFGGQQVVAKPKKPKKLTPKYVFIFDDISEDLRHPSIAYLLKKNRHLGIMNIISTQSYKDIVPSAWRQIDFALLFKNLDSRTLEDIKIKLSLPTSFSDFEALYNFAVEGNHNFLYIDKNTPEYRQNFCNIIEI